MDTQYTVTDLLWTSGTMLVDATTTVGEFVNWFSGQLESRKDDPNVTDALKRTLHGIQTGARDAEAEQFLGVRVERAPAA